MTDIWSILLPLAYFGATLLATWLVAWLVSAAIGRALIRSPPVVATQARQIGGGLVWVIGIVFALQLLGIALSILFVLIALMGVGFIVALREPLENMAARYFADVYVAFDRGDTITIHGVTGTVVEINPIATILIAPDDTLVSIPNSSFMRETVLNTTPHAWARVTVPMVIPSSVDISAFESAMLKSCAKLRLHLDERFPPSLAVKSRTAQSTEFTLTLMIRTPGEREAIVGEVNRALTKVLQDLKATRS